MIDAIVIGSGPNGLAAAITLATAGRSVRVYEGRDTVGGGLRSLPLTEPGSIHDAGAAVMAMVVASPCFSALPLADHGVALVTPEAPWAHPLDDGTVVMSERSVGATAANLDRDDAEAYRRLLDPFVGRANRLLEELLQPIGRRISLDLMGFGLQAIRSAQGLARARFRGPRAAALLAGSAAHSLVPLNFAGTAGYGLALAISAHAYGWPVVRGGSQRLADALEAILRARGGEIVTGTPVRSLSDLPPARAIVCDVTPRQLIHLAGDRLPAAYRHRLERYRHGPGVFKMDWTLREPVPWRAADCGRAGTLHLGGTIEEIAASEQAAWDGRLADRPFTLVVQPTVIDPSRAAPGKHTLWAYCHVPNGANTDRTAAIEAQIERFAPGFRDCISSRHSMGPADLERYNPNLIGGDIAGGAATVWQLMARPTLSWHPHRTKMPGVFLCSSSTPPGIGVHGMCGYLAAQEVLRRAS
jgi:phytoene dehydrogenase-like protein